MQLSFSFSLIVAIALWLWFIYYFFIVNLLWVMIYVFCKMIVWLCIELCILHYAHAIKQYDGNIMHFGTSFFHYECCIMLYVSSSVQHSYSELWNDTCYYVIPIMTSGGTTLYHNLFDKTECYIAKIKIGPRAL